MRVSDNSVMSSEPDVSATPNRTREPGGSAAIRTRRAGEGRRFDCERRLEQPQIATARNLDRAELGEVVGEPLRVEQHEPARAQSLDERDQCDLRCVGGAMEHRFAEEGAPDRDAVESPDELI